MAATIVGLALVIAVASSSTSLWAPAREGQADRGGLLLTVAIAAGAAFLASLAVAAIVHRVVLSQRPDPPSVGATVVRAIPVACAAAALLSLLAISWTRLEPVPGAPGETTTTTTTEVTEGPIGGNGGELGDPNGLGTLQAGDFDGDGRLDLGVDLDGDGGVDRLVVPASGEGVGEAGLAGDGVLRVSCPETGLCRAGVDVDGDGVVDQRIAIDSSLAGLDAIERTELQDRYRTTEDLFDEGRPASDPSVDPADDGTTFENTGTDDTTPSTQPDPDGLQDQDRPEEEDEDDGPSVLGPILLVVLGGLAMVVVVLIILAVARNGFGGRGGRGAPGELLPPEPDAEAERARERMVESVDDSIEAMLADPDPRTAIIGAYARLLEGLAAGGVARRDHEAPIEHLQRALGLLSVRPEPLQALIGLFEVARFSTHALGEADRALALDALRAAGQDLAAARPPAPAPPPPVGASR